jgi:hypothetical protein
MSKPSDRVIRNTQRPIAIDDGAAAHAPPPG